MGIQMTHTFTLDENQIEELKMLQKAMQKHAVETGDTKENAENYYTLEKVFEFVMMLGQNQMISEKIENVAWHYREYYDK